MWGGYFTLGIAPRSRDADARRAGRAPVRAHDRHNQEVEMPIIVRGSTGNTNPAPAGVHAAVLVDVIDLGERTTPWGKKLTVELLFQVGEVDPDTNERFIVRAMCTASLHEKSRLAQLMAGLLGRTITDDERAGGLDIEKLVGRGCQLLVSHGTGKRGGTFANVDACIPLPEDTRGLHVSGYVRECERGGSDRLPGGEAAAPSEERFPWKTPASLTEDGR